MVRRKERPVYVLVTRIYPQILFDLHHTAIASLRDY